MKSNNIPNAKADTKNKFLGSYITSMHDYPNRSYISVGMKDGTETIYIMIFKKSGYGNKKYTNPLVKIIKDAFEQSIPVACVYNEGTAANVMISAYTNFSSTHSSNEIEEKDDLSVDNQEEYEQLKLPIDW